METCRIAEIDLQIQELKKDYPEVYGWIILKEKQKELQEKLSSDNPLENSDENRKELAETENSMLDMKKKYSSLMLYDALMSVKQRIIKNSEDIDGK